MSETPLGLSVDQRFLKRKLGLDASLIEQIMGRLQVMVKNFTA